VRISFATTGSHTIYKYASAAASGPVWSSNPAPVCNVAVPGKCVRHRLQLDSRQQCDGGARLEAGERVVLEVAERRLGSIQPAVDVADRHSHPAQRLGVVRSVQSIYVNKVKLAHTRLPSAGFRSRSRFLAVSLHAT